MRGRRRPTRLRLAAVGLLTVAIVATLSAAPRAASAAGRPGAAAAGSAGNAVDSPGHPPAATDSTDGSALAALVPTAATLQAVRAGLPDDPVSAGEALVGKIFGDDQVAAVSATAEILRRAGLPLVSARGPVVALPDHSVIVNIPIDVEFLPMLTNAVRTGVVYTPGQLSQTLQFLGITTTPMTDAQVVGTLAAWGKTPGAPTETITAGAAVRALADRRGQLLVPSALSDPQTDAAVNAHPASVDPERLARTTAPGSIRDLDPLQYLLFLAHAGSEVVGGVTVTTTPPTSGTGKSTPTGLRRPGAAADGICDYLDEEHFPGGPDSPEKSVLNNAFRLQIGYAVAIRFGKESAEILDDSFSGYDKAADIVATGLMLMGTKLDLTADKETTHFRHQHGDDSRNVTFTATASFHSPIDQGQLSCWAFAGVSIPANGALSGYQVHWKVKGGIQLLNTTPASSATLANGGTTDETGESHLELYPRTEAHPPSGGAAPEHTAYQGIYAYLDKDDFPVKFTDAIDVIMGGMAGGPAGALVEAAWKFGMAFVKKVGMPAKKWEYPVTYHGSNPYVMWSGGSLYVVFTASIQVSAQVYSCNGVRGPWKGTMSYTGDADPILIAAGRLAGADIPSTGTGSGQKIDANFTLDPKSSAPQKVPLGDSPFGLQVTLDPDAIAQADRPEDAGDSFARLKDQLVVGTGEWTIGSLTFTETHLMGVSLVNGSQVQVLAVLRDERCPGSSIWDDAFDPNG